jgi:hypothetical protein
VTLPHEVSGKPSARRIRTSEPPSVEAIPGSRTSAGLASETTSSRRTTVTGNGGGSTSGTSTSVCTMRSYVPTSSAPRSAATSYGISASVQPPRPCAVEKTTLILTPVRVTRAVRGTQPFGQIPKIVTLTASPAFGLSGSTRTTSFAAYSGTASVVSRRRRTTVVRDIAQIICKVRAARAENN